MSRRLMENRTIIGEERLPGRVIECKGHFSWILPMRSLNHYAANWHSGRVYCAADDFEEYADVGAVVSFVAYLDSNGIGGAAVRLEETPESTAYEPAEAEEASVGAAAGAGPTWESTRPQRTEVRDAMERLEQVLRETVKPAVHGIRHLEPEWTEEDTVECIVKNFHIAGQMPELLTAPWGQAVARFIEHALRGYATTCCERPWFFQLDLAEAFRNALWEILGASRCAHPPTFEEIEAVANNAYEEQMDAMLMDRALWEASVATFQDEAVCNQVYWSLHASHGAATGHACNEARQLDETQRVEAFIQRWMEESMGRAWQALEAGGSEQLKEQSIAELFQRLLNPFGEEHPFSCVPFSLTERIGRLPSDSPIVLKAASKLTASWAEVWPEPEAWEPQAASVVAAC